MPRSERGTPHHEGEHLVRRDRRAAHAPHRQVVKVAPRVEPTRAVRRGLLTASLGGPAAARACSPSFPLTLVMNCPRAHALIETAARALTVSRQVAPKCLPPVPRRHLPRDRAVAAALRARDERARQMPRE